MISKTSSNDKSTNFFLDPSQSEQPSPASSLQISEYNRVTPHKVNFEWASYRSGAAISPFRNNYEQRLANLDVPLGPEKCLDVNGYKIDVCSNQDFPAGVLRGKTSVPSDLTVIDVLTAFTALNEHKGAKGLSAELKESQLLNPNGTAANTGNLKNPPFNNPVSYTETIDGREYPHYLVHQYLDLETPFGVRHKVHHVLDFVLIETKDAWIFSWQGVSAEYADVLNSSEFKGKSSEINFGNWFIKKDGSEMGYSMCASDTAQMIALFPDFFAKALSNMADYAKRRLA